MEALFILLCRDQILRIIGRDVVTGRCPGDIVLQVVQVCYLHGIPPLIAVRENKWRSEGYEQSYLRRFATMMYGGRLLR